MNLDSLWGVWMDTSKPDTVRLKAINSIAWDGFLFTQPDSAHSIAQLEYDYALHKGDLKWQGKALNIQGCSFLVRGDYENASTSFNRTLKIFEELNDKEGMANALGNLGLVYKNQGDLTKAIRFYERSIALNESVGNEVGVSNNLKNIARIDASRGNLAQAITYYRKSLKIEEQIGNDKGVAMTLNGIASIYELQNDYSNALRHYQKSHELSKGIEDKYGMLAPLHNMGNIFAQQGKLDSALFFYEKSFTIANEIDDLKSEAASLETIATIYLEKKNEKLAIDYYEKGLSIAKQLGDATIISTCLNGLGNVYFRQGKATAAISYYTEALDWSYKSENPTKISAAANSLYLSYKAVGNGKKALENYEVYVQMRDSLLSEENQREVIRQEYKYDYEKQAVADSIQNAEAQKVKDAQIEAQEAKLETEKNQRYALFGGLGLVSIFSGLMYNRFRVTRKQKEVIEIQKKEVEEKKEQVEKKNHEILESINYAKKLQTAVLPPAKVVKEFFNESFLLYLPRDIVSGDFYWMENKGDTSYFAVADCTGHGVPGAMLSVIGLNGLNRALNEQKLTNPKDILTSLSETVNRHFEGSDTTVRDGMDICLCSLNSKTNLLTFAGANIPVWIARKEEMIVLKGDRRAIGHDDLEREFTQQEIQLEKGDVIYLASDGYQDQLGGENYTKFMTRTFREKLLQLSDRPMEEQRAMLISELDGWKGATPQTDDVCVMSVRV